VISPSRTKTLGAVGSIFVLLTAVPSVGWLLGIVGFIFVLVAIRDIANQVQDRSIFNNTLLSVILAISGIVVGTVVILGSFFSFAGLHNLAGPDYFGPNFNPSTVPVGDWVGLATAVVTGLAIVWILLIVSAVYLRRSFDSIASRLNVKLFGTAGLLYLVGAATVIVGVGFLLIFVAQILLVVAFFSIDERTLQAMPR
jgi:uncharacterized membrane protein